jgi:protein required for attachment to host cells
MSELMLRRDTRILVCDGRTALFLRNAGVPRNEKFEVEQTMREEEATHTADLGADKPGRVAQVLAGPTSSIEGTDWHTEQETAFINRAVEAFQELCEKAQAKEIVIVAPPKALATIRQHNPDWAAKAVAQIAKDLTKHPVPEIQRIVLG